MSGVFAAINKAADAKDATSAFGLKRVTKDMKSKNIKDPVLVPKQKKSEEVSGASSSKAWGAKEVRGEPRLALDKGTWFCEFYESKGAGGEPLVIPDVQMKQNVYITRCRNMRISVPDKCKSISIDKCERVTLEFKAVVSTLEVVNSARCTVTALDMVPAVAIDKSNGISIVLSESVLAQTPSPPDLVTSNISECNLVVPGKAKGDDPVEMPLPEQYKTVYNLKTRKLETEPVSHGG